MGSGGGIKGILNAFSLLNVWGNSAGFWKVSYRTPHKPLHMVALGRKRYVTAYPNGDGSWHIVGGTEHSLGGGVVDPPALRGRDGNRRHIWTYPVADHVLPGAIARGGQSLPAFVAPWDPPGAAPFPVLRRFSAASPAYCGASRSNSVRTRSPPWSRPSLTRSSRDTLPPRWRSTPVRTWLNGPPWPGSTAPARSM